MTEDTNQPTQEERLDQAIDDVVDLNGTVGELLAALIHRRRAPDGPVGDLPGIAARCRRLAAGLETAVDAEAELRAVVDGPHAFVGGPGRWQGPASETCAVCGTDPRNSRHVNRPTSHAFVRRPYSVDCSVCGQPVSNSRHVKSI
jgi:hypothetical protein